MQPPPPLYALWAKAGVDQQGVRDALLGCGFPSASHVDGTTITNNDYARGEQCMLGKGFAYQERHTYCDAHPHLAACPATDGAAAAGHGNVRPPMNNGPGRTPTRSACSKPCGRAATPR